MIHPRAGEPLLAARHGAAVLSCRVSMQARPTRMELVVQASGGSVEVDLFHGFAMVQGGASGRWRKIARPFADAAGRAGAATRNLALRTIAREPAYPALRTLIRRFYAAVAGAAPPPLTPQRVLDVALARDVLLDRLGLHAGAAHHWPREHVARLRTA